MHGPLFYHFLSQASFFFLDNRQYIFQRQLETNTAGASSLQAKAIEAGRLLGLEEKEKLESSVYFAASWAAAFPLLLTQKKNKHETKEFAPNRMSDTTEEIAHWGQPEWSRIESIQSLESLSTMISLQFSPLAFHNSLPPVLFFLYIVSLFFINIFLSLMSKKEDDDFTPHYTCKLIRHLVMTIQLLPLPSKNLEK